MRYPFASLKELHQPIVDELKRAACDVIDTGWFLHGEYTSRFESTLGNICEVPYVVGVSNGLDALRLIFRAYIEMQRLSKGDEVIVPANTFIASVLAVTDNGLVPVFVEPDYHTMNLDTAKIEQAITPRTCAILTVHLYGSPCYDATLREVAAKHQLLIVEDNAQAIGARSAIASPYGTYTTGSLGDAAAFSFYPGKNIGALGDAGAVATHDKALADTVRALGNYGSEVRYHNMYAGLNCRIDELQAALLLVKLKYLEAETARRNAVAQAYGTHIDNTAVTTPAFIDGTLQVWHQYVIRTPHRDAFMQYLKNNEVGCDIHYPIPPHRQACYAQYNALSLPVASRLAEEVVSLPIMNITPDDAVTIAHIINRFSL